MAKRRSSKNDDGLGCLFAIFEIIGALLIALFASGNPTAKKIAWGILGVLALFYILTSGGVSGESAMLIIGLIVVVVVIILVIIASVGDSDREKNNITATSTGVTENNSITASRTSVVKRETFEEQLKKMEQQAKVVCGENFRVTKTDEKISITETVKRTDCYTASEPMTMVHKTKDKYYCSVEEALEQQTVPTGYQKIMIERILKTDINECPGLIWKDDVMLYVLPLLRNSKVYSWPLASIPIILYEKRKNPDVDKEFMEVGQADIAAEFEEVFPEYPFGQDGVYTGKFMLPVGLEVTNTSGKVLFNILSAEFHVVDDITQSMWYAKEIKELYQKNILKENGVISYEKYMEEKLKLLHAYRVNEKNDERYDQQIVAAKELGL